MIPRISLLIPTTWLSSSNLSLHYLHLTCCRCNNLGRVSPGFSNVLPRRLSQRKPTSSLTTSRTITMQSATTGTPTSPESSDDSTIRSQKQVLRKEIRAKVKALSDDEIARQSDQVWERLFALPEYQSAKSVGLFLSMPQNEIKTETALRQCVQDQKIIYVPQVGKNFERADMELLRVVLADLREQEEGDTIFYETWPKNKWGIPEPPADMPQEMAKPGDIDLLIVPGLGFDRQGHRIGQGKGYYDRFIARIAQDSTPNLVAVTLECQLVDSIPVSPLDRVMDTIILPSEVIHVKSD